MSSGLRSKIILSRTFPRPRGISKEQSKPQRMIKGQPKHWSLIESLTNVGVGFGVSFGATFVVLPLFGFIVNWQQNLLISLIFTIISIVRSYFLRRYFNWVHHGIPTAGRNSRDSNEADTLWL
jgi:hypothetical protein